MDNETLNDMQKKIDEEYLKYGLTEKVVDKQIELNKLRNEHNINSDTELNEDGYVQ